MLEESIRQSQLIDQVVLDRATMDECGRIEVMWCYPKVHRVLGFICKSGSFERTKKAFNLDQLEKVGENGVLVNSEPVETDRDRVRQLETLIGCEVWTDEGKRVGRINDYVFQLGSGNIRYYLLALSGVQALTGKLYSLYPNQILGYGRGRVMVSGGIVPGLELYQVGLDQKLEQKFTGLEERLERKLKRVAERVNEGLNSEAPVELQASLQSFVQRAKSVTSDVTNRVKERAQDFLDEGLVERRSDDKSDYDDREVYDNEFDFDDWDESMTDSSSKTSSDLPRPIEKPIERPIERPIEQSINQSNTQSGAQRYSKRSPKFDLDVDQWSEPEVQIPRPPLNLSNPQPKKSPTDFTAKPRPSTESERSSNDPWDEDWD